MFLSNAMIIWLFHDLAHYFFLSLICHIFHTTHWFEIALDIRICYSLIWLFLSWASPLLLFILFRWLHIHSSLHLSSPPTEKLTDPWACHQQKIPDQKTEGHLYSLVLSSITSSTPSFCVLKNTVQNSTTERWRQYFQQGSLIE